MHLLGPYGGLFALGMICGIVLTWGVNLRIINPYVKAAHDAQIAQLLNRIEALEREVERLRTIEEKHTKLIEDHARKTLAVQP
ncbi:MAG: hypothetical protein ACRCUE_15140 [Bosea sp. (in: a-proteobacteria)]